MKNKFFALAVVSLLFFVSCSKNENNNNNAISPLSVNTTVSSGNWRVTYFWDTDHEETNNFSGYNFTFSPGAVLTAVKGASNISGTWNTAADNSTVKLLLVFAIPPDFEEISEDWQVIERTDSRIKLQHVSGGNGGTDYLTFEKN